MITYVRCACYAGVLIMTDSHPPRCGVQTISPSKFVSGLSRHAAGGVTLQAQGQAMDRR